MTLVIVNTIKNGTLRACALFPICYAIEDLKLP